MSEAILPTGPEFPPEVERLLNPPFCAGLIARAAVRFVASQTRPEPASSNGLPYLLAFLIAPLALHAPTREEINSHKANYGLHRFVRGRPDLLPGLDRRVEGFRAATQAGLLFGFTHGCLHLDPDSLRITGDRRFAASLSGSGGLPEAAASPVHAAERLGAWFAGAGIGQVFLSLQLTP